MKTKLYVISALCDAINECDEIIEIDGIEDRWAVMLDCGSNEFNGSFSLLKLADDCVENDPEWNTVCTFDLSTYWNYPSEIMTMGNDILSEIAEEILAEIEKKYLPF